MQIQTIEIDKLVSNSGQIDGLPANPRNISKEQFASLKKSISENPEMLSLRELIVYPHDGKYIVIAGNMRLQAMLSLDYTDAICKVLDKETTAEQLRAYTIKDNVGYGEWSFDLLANEWEIEELQEWGLDLPEDFVNIEEDGQEFLADEDEVPEQLDTYVCKAGDLWLLGNNRLMCGDSTLIDDVEKLMNGNKADMVFTDPPYNIAINGKAGKIMNDDMDAKSFYNFLKEVMINYYSIMKDGAVIYVAHADTENHNFVETFKNSGLKLSQILIWVKQSATMSRQDFNWRHEPILYGWKEGERHYYCKDFTQTTVFENKKSDYTKLSKQELIKLIRKNDDDKFDGTTIIKHDRPTISELHPTMKPIGLLEKFIGFSSKKKWLVVDLFGGSGSTLIACEKTGRINYSMELDPKYCDVIIKRWQNYTGKKAILESTKQTFEELTNGKIY